VSNLAGRCCVLAALGLLAACAPPTPQAEPAFSAVGLDRIRGEVQTDIDAQRIAGAVLLLHHARETVLFESFGLRDVASGDPMMHDTIFRIFSMTKPVTSVAVMMLDERGALDIDDSVGRYLPELAELEVLTDDGTLVPAGREITIRDLLSHTGGLTYGLFADTPIDRAYREAEVLIGAPTSADIVARLGTLPLKHQPGAAWEYSVSTDVLGRLVEVVSGQALDLFFEREIFAPLGMLDTGFFVPVEKLPRLAGYYQPGDGGLQVVADVWRVVDQRPSLLSGGGGLFSTATDYLTFCRMVLNGGAIDGTRLLTPASIEEMATDHLSGLAGRSDNVLRAGPYVIPGGFGLGFAVDKTDTPAGSSRRLFWYGIASTSFWIDLDQGLIGIYLVQHEPLDMSLGNRFRDLTYDAATFVSAEPLR